MKTDTYTKAVLTVIAGSLLVIALTNVPIISPAMAELNQSDVSYCWDGATIDKVSDTKWKISTYC